MIKAGVYMDDLIFNEYTEEDEKKFNEGQVRLLFFDTNINDDWVDLHDAVGNFGKIGFYPNKVEFNIWPIGSTIMITEYTSINIGSAREPNDPHFLLNNLLLKVKFQNSETGQWWEIKFEARPDKAKEIYNNLETIINSQSKACFVATTVYGDINCDQVEKLRKWRDTYLKKNSIGRSFIKFYYKNGENWARLISPHPFLKKTIKTGLDIFTKFLK